MYATAYKLQSMQLDQQESLNQTIRCKDAHKPWLH